MAEDPSPIRVIPNDFSYYSPLNASKREIRLLHIHPASRDNEGLVCSLVLSRLGKTPPYQALSYCWGSLDDTVPVTLVFQEHLEVDSSHFENVAPKLHDFFESGDPTIRLIDNFQITTNLHAALLSLRTNNTDDRAAFVWVDSICINQGNVVERSNQVRAMYQVYEQAESVVIWLGGDPFADSGVFQDEDGDIDMFSTIMDFVGFNKGRVDREMFDVFEERILKLEDWDWDYLVEEFDEIVQALPPAPLLQNGQTWTPEAAVYRFIFWIHFPLLEKMKLVSLYTKDSAGTLEDYPSLIEYLSRILLPDSSVWGYVGYLLLGAENCLRYISAIGPEKFLAWSAATRKFGSQIMRRTVQLSSNEWFRRSWVLQEVVSNPKVLVRHGKSEVSWSKLRTLCWIYSQMVISWSKQNPEEFIRRADQDRLLSSTIPAIWSEIGKRNNTKKAEDQFALLRLLQKTSELQATDVRDKIFAVFHLANDVNTSLFLPDYTLSVEDVFCRFTRWIIETQKSPQVLTFAGTSNNNSRIDSLPTWVPDYHDLPTDSLTLSEHSFRASAEAYICIRPTTNSKVLRVQGLPIAAVERIVSLQDFYTYFELHDHEFSWWNFIPAPVLWAVLYQTYLDQFSPASSQGQYAEDAKPALFTPDVLVKALSAFSDSPKFSPTELSRHWLEVDPHSTSLELKNEAIAKKIKMLHPPRDFFLDPAGWMSPGSWNFFFSHNGRFGVCPKDTEEGDLVVAINGARVPSVLRLVPIPEESTTSQRLQMDLKFDFIGECYLDGAMYGELMENPLIHDYLHADPLDPDLVSDPSGKYGVKGGYPKRFFDIQ
jgi:hypothetical protein